jgi:hypothetical protein
MLQLSGWAYLARRDDLALDFVEKADQSLFDRVLATGSQFGGAEGTQAKPLSIDVTEVDPRDPRPWKALRALLCREWWTRTWIIQEALLSNHCKVVCGIASTNLSNFATLHSSFMSKQTKHYLMPSYIRHVFRGVPFMEFISRFNTFRLPFRQEHLGWEHKKHNLVPVMFYSSTAGCTMLRDRIYALLALCDEQYHQNIKVDYIAQDRDILLQAFQYLIRTAGLAAIQLGKLRKKPDFGLPSWVPDLGAEFSSGQWFQEFLSKEWFLPCGYDLSREPWRADASPGHWNNYGCPKWEMPQKDVSGAFSVRFSEDYQTLACRRFAFDTVEVVESAWLFSKQEIDAAVQDMEDLHLGSWDKRLCHLEQVAMSYSVNPYPNKIAAFWNTLHANRDGAARKFPYKEGARHVLPERETAHNVWFQRISLLLNERTFVITKNGCFGLGPPDARQGGLICVLHTAHVPFVLRRTSGREFQFVGDSYIHGISEGEIFDWARVSGRVIEEFWIR